jgi:hypothetical protein
MFHEVAVIHLLDMIGEGQLNHDHSHQAPEAC